VCVCVCVCEFECVVGVVVVHSDLLRNADLRLACSVFFRAQVPTKTIGCFLQLGEYAKIIQYAKSVRFTPDYPVLLQQLHRFKPEEANAFAIMLLQNEDGALIDITQVMSTFMQVNDIANTTGVLHAYLKGRGDREEDGPLQTKLLEINLLGAPHVARALLQVCGAPLAQCDCMLAAAGGGVLERG
jgi:clathrin heavy chain